jgi:predicted nucleic acid-binding protein
MRLIIDSNCLFSALIKDSVSRKIIFNPEVELFAPDHIMSEIGKYYDLLLRKSKLSLNEFEVVFEGLFHQIEIISHDDILPYYPKAQHIMKDIDPDDAPFIALALAIDNDGIWSMDPHLTKQDVILVWRTEGLVNKLHL